MRLLTLILFVVLTLLAVALLFQTGWNSASGALGIGRLSLAHAFGVTLAVSALSWLSDASKQKSGGSTQ